MTVVLIIVIIESAPHITAALNRITEVTMFARYARQLFVVQIVAIGFVAALLTAKWAAGAELEGCHAYEAECSERPLANGHPGETVRVCERVQLICSSLTEGKSEQGSRQGTTVAWHLRHGKLLAAR